MSNNTPGSNECDKLFPPIDSTIVNPQSPPKTKRKARKSTEIERTPDRSGDSTNRNTTNNVTPATTEHSNSRENKDAKRARMQQTLNNFFTDLNKNKQDMSQRNVVTQVQEKRLRTGKRLVPSGLGARLRKKKRES